MGSLARRMLAETDAPSPDAPRPVASVVIPVRDGGELIEEQLAALSRQSTDAPWEVIVVDDGSRDGTPDRVRRWAGRLPSLTVLERSGPAGSGHARNAGAAVAQGELLLFCDADDVVADTWLSAHLEALSTHGLVTGPILTTTLNDAAAVTAGPPASWRTTPAVGNRFLPYALGANLGVRREVFDAVGGFDGSRRHGNDKVFSWTAQLTGTDLHFAPEAAVHYRLRPDVEGTFRRQRSIARSAPSLYRRFRAHGMPRSSLRGALEDWLRLLIGLPRLVTRSGRIELARTAGRRLGRLEGSIRERTLYL